MAPRLQASAPVQPSDDPSFRRTMIASFAAVLLIGAGDIVYTFWHQIASMLFPPQANAAQLPPPRTSPHAPSDSTRL